MSHPASAAVDLKVARIRRALLIMWLVWVVYFVGAILVLNVIRVPAHLPWWFIFFVIVLLAPVVLTPLMRVWIVHVQAKDARQRLDRIIRDLDELS